jgi:hypothetical protein
MNNQRLTEKDYKMWREDYLNGMSSQKIYEKYSPNGPSLSQVKKVIRTSGLARSHSKAQKGRIPWNKGKTGFVVWNSGMASTGNYPYASSFKGKESPFKGVPRYKEDKNKISHSGPPVFRRNTGIRLQNRESYVFYRDRAGDEDTLYLIKVSSNQDSKIQYKIGRTFNSINRHYSWNLEDKEIIKLWFSNHTIIFQLEHDVLNEFKNYRARKRPVRGPY